jgi:hypothetical protein
MMSNAAYFMKKVWKQHLVISYVYVKYFQIYGTLYLPKYTQNWAFCIVLSWGGGQTLVAPSAETTTEVIVHLRSC